MRVSVTLGFTKQTETSPGVWEDVITERPALGTVKQRSEILDRSESILPKYRTTTSISLLSKGVYKEEYGDIAYVEFRGTKWTPGSITENPPRLTIYIGEEYNGPAPQ